MIRYVIRRVALAVVVVAGVVILTFVISDVVPGDPAASWAGPHASAAQIARARHYLGLDQPLAVRIGKYFAGVVSGNWGTSIHTHRPVLSDIGTAAPATLELVIAALIIAVLVGIPLGLAAARWPGGALDHAIRVGSVLGVSMPVFWLALILQLVFAYSLVNTFLVESIFDWPGLGSYAAASVSTLDTPAIVGVTLFVAVIYVVANLVVDLVQAALDPRIRLR